MGGLTKATLVAPEMGLIVKAMFNPKELSVSKSVPWQPQASAGADVPEQQFTTGQGRQLSFELFFDRFEEDSSVIGDVESVNRMACIYGEKHRPPIVQFVWGSFVFHGVIKQIQIRYTMFLEKGDPCRATVSVTMDEHMSLEEQGKAEKRQSPDHAKLRRVKRGETLHSIAAMEYDDAAQWRRIADANGIDNPMDLAPGTELLVPPILSF